MPLALYRDVEASHPLRTQSLSLLGLPRQQMSGGRIGVGHWEGLSLGAAKPTGKMEGRGMRAGHVTLKIECFAHAQFL